jgi:hypothetical protein
MLSCQDLLPLVAESNKDERLPSTTIKWHQSNYDNDGLLLTVLRLPFSSRYNKMHTHASVNNLLYNLGSIAFTRGDPNNQVLTPPCASRWLSFQKPAIQKVVKKPGACETHNQTARPEEKGATHIATEVRDI